MQFTKQAPWPVALCGLAILLLAPPAPLRAQTTGDKTPAATAESTSGSSGAPPSEQQHVAAKTPETLPEVLREAARQKKSKESRALLEDATEKVNAGAKVDQVGEQNRTALHWIAIGTSQSKDKKLLEDYRRLAELLIDRDANVNAEDKYGNTPLDWAETSEDEGLRYLLRQAGAEHGSSHNDAQRMRSFVNDLRAMALKKDYASLTRALQSDLPAGTVIRVRLKTPIHSKNSRPGDEVHAVVVAPARDGEKVLMEAGTEVEGTILLARAAGNRYSRAEVAVDFTNFIHTDKKVTRLATQITEVDNARETVGDQRVIGVPFPNEIVGRWTLGLRGLGFVMPGVSEALQWSTRAYNMTLGREIEYPEGSEILLKVSVPDSLSTRAVQKDWKRIPASKELTDLVRGLPMRVATSSGEESDITNLLFIGSQEDLETGFRLAGWVEAQGLNVKSAAQTAFAALRRHGYEEAPFAKLLLNGEAPTFEFQKDLNTIAKRHHARVFRLPGEYQGHPLWLASATHDIGIGTGRMATHWYHLIDPEIDLERQKVADDLLFTGVASGYSVVPRPNAPLESKNATGDIIRTDGNVVVLHMTGSRKSAASAE